ncbi:Ig-like domain-containing protein [Variovorax sp. LT1R16]|uniref:Ig-like domain-containing protein n=1 Tax=Variovorax sp. LT1R16 TaxID=3443728 RepID=UPI003F485BBF
MAQSTLTLDVLGGGGASTTSISSIEIAQVKAVLKDAKGAVVKGAIVTFSETGAGLLTFSPAAKTALTDDTGTAIVEVRATDSSIAGATMLTAAATAAGTAVTAQKAISISSAPPTGGVDPQTLANALNFLDVNPADRSIVIKGSGGNGRSESATLRFRVVDKNNSPVKGATVTFSVTPANAVTLNVPTATSDSEGVVVTTVSSGAIATAVVVRATVDGKSITSQSDQLTVTTGLANPKGFDMSAGKYNLNSRKTGDSTKILVRIVDVNGNPVADGVPVVFTANYGAVGSSSRGGCTTLGGACDVDYVVQDPRPVDGQFATVIASTLLGDGTSIGKQLEFVMSDLILIDLFAGPALLNSSQQVVPVVSTLNLQSCALKTFSLYAGTPKAFPAPANTTIALQAITADLAATLTNGSPVLDQLARPPFRTSVDFSVDVSKIAGPEACGAGGNQGVAFVDFKFTNDGITQTRRLTVTYPKP